MNEKYRIMRLTCQSQIEIFRQRLALYDLGRCSKRLDHCFLLGTQVGTSRILGASVRALTPKDVTKCSLESGAENEKPLRRSPIGLKSCTPPTLSATLDQLRDAATLLVAST